MLSNRALVFAIARWFVAIIVIAFLIAAVRSAWLQLADSKIDWSETRPGWILLAGLFYFLGMCGPGIFWHRCLVATGQSPNWADSLGAFFISQLGKYVPGKAMVVVLRTNEIRKAGVDGTVAAVTVFVETLTSMSVGATLGALVLAFAFREHQWLIGIAIAIAFLSGLPTLSPVLRKIIRTLKVKLLDPQIDAKLQALGAKFMLSGWLILLVGWLLMGFSLYCVLQAMPSPRPLPGDFPLILACVSLAIVTGFLSLLPGGIGVRELVMLPLLGPVVGPVSALVSVVLLRLIWLLVELLTAAAFKLVRLSPFNQKPVLS